MTPDALRPLICGGEVQVRYDGGSRPGTWRTVQAARIDGAHLAGLCDGSPRRLLLSKILDAAAPAEEEEAPPDYAPSDTPPPDPPDYLDSF